MAEYPKSDSVPEALYWRGVCCYKATDDPRPLKEAYEQLKADWSPRRFRTSTYSWTIGLERHRVS
jgi:hypothetical protein